MRATLGCDLGPKIKAEGKVTWLVKDASLQIRVLSFDVVHCEHGSQPHPW